MAAELEFESWTRNTFDVQAIQVTDENLRQVAEWCKGEVLRTMSHNTRTYILVDNVVRRGRLTQVKVFAGDWLLFANGQYKHYRNRSFELVYHRKVDPREKLRELLVHQYRDGFQNVTMNPDWFIEKIMDVVEGTSDE